MLWRPRGVRGDCPLQPASVLTRRRVIGTAVTAAAVAFIRPAPAISFAPRSVSLYNTHTSEWVRTVYWADGHYIRDAVRDINWVLRDHHSDEVRPMNAGVLDLLGMLRHRLDCHDPFLVICGYRSETTNHRMYLPGDGVASNTFHINAMALDLRCEGPHLSHVRA